MIIIAAIISFFIFIGFLALMFYILSRLVAGFAIILLLIIIFIIYKTSKRNKNQ
ncbi:hypothetical protein [Mycoplasma sp. P36-A1]|uniref:hypothetical protein n=1 Tax=Mycoplasma sp. P36-A1 TaxID=3252900 RepID=UPI003C2FD891